MQKCPKQDLMFLQVLKGERKSKLRWNSYKTSQLCGCGGIERLLQCFLSVFELIFSTQSCEAPEEPENRWSVVIHNWKINWNSLSPGSVWLLNRIVWLELQNVGTAAPTAAAAVEICPNNCLVCLLLFSVWWELFFSRKDSQRESHLSRRSHRDLWYYNVFSEWALMHVRAT